MCESPYHLINVHPLLLLSLYLYSNAWIRALPWALNITNENSVEEEKKMYTYDTYDIIFIKYACMIHYKWMLWICGMRWHVYMDYGLWMLEIACKSATLTRNIVFFFFSFFYFIFFTHTAHTHTKHESSSVDSETPFLTKIQQLNFVPFYLPMKIQRVFLAYISPRPRKCYVCCADFFPLKSFEVSESQCPVKNVACVGADATNTY